MYLVAIVLFAFTIFMGAMVSAVANHGRNEQAQLSVFSAFVIVFVLAAMAALVLMV